MLTVSFLPLECHLILNTIRKTLQCPSCSSAEHSNIQCFLVCILRFMSKHLSLWTLYRLITCLEIVCIIKLRQGFNLPQINYDKCVLWGRKICFYFLFKSPRNRLAQLHMLMLPDSYCLLFHLTFRLFACRTKISFFTAMTAIFHLSQSTEHPVSFISDRRR